MISGRQCFTLIFVLSFCASLAFKRSFSPTKFLHRRSAVAMSDTELDEEVKYKSLVVSGFLSKEYDFAEAFVFSNLFKTGKWSDLTSITDSIKFARKRLMSPGLVYSGLTDVLKFAEVDKTEVSLESALAGREAWLSFNVTSAELPLYATIAAKVGLKRAIFAVCVPPEESGDGVTFDSAVATLSAANIDYTIIKYGLVRRMGEAKFPYKIVKGDVALPSEGSDILSSGDLMRVLVEIVDLPKTFNTVYGIGPGTRLDAEISFFMKSQGWPERVQVGLLLGDFMDKLQVRYDEEVIIKAEQEIVKAGEKKKNALALPTEGEGNKFAGFF